MVDRWTIADQGGSAAAHLAAIAWDRPKRGFICPKQLLKSIGVSISGGPSLTMSVGKPWRIFSTHLGQVPVLAGNWLLNREIPL